jgi:predicted PurR-regulated permease PerM
LNQNNDKYRVWWILAFFIVLSIVISQSCGYAYKGTTSENLAWGFAFLCLYLVARIANRTITECQQATLWMKVFVTIMLFVTAVSSGLSYSAQLQLTEAKQEIQSLQSKLQAKQTKLQAKQNPAKPASAEKTITKSVTPSEPSPPSKSKAVEEDIIANSRTGIFHRADCQYVSRMSAGNMVPYSSRDDAIDDGYRPCKKCRP